MAPSGRHFEFFKKLKTPKFLFFYRYSFGKVSRKSKKFDFFIGTTYVEPLISSINVLVKVSDDFKNFNRKDWYTFKKIGN